MSARFENIFFLRRDMARKLLSGELLLFLAWLVIIGLSLRLTPDVSGRGTHTQLGLPPCAFKFLTQRPCPACGLTTSFANIARGNMQAAIAAHPLGPLVFLYFAIAAAYSVSKIIWRYRLVVQPKIAFAVNTFLISVFLAFGVFRMFF